MGGRHRWTYCVLRTSGIRALALVDIDEGVARRERAIILPPPRRWSPPSLPVVLGLVFKLLQDQLSDVLQWAA